MEYTHVIIEIRLYFVILNVCKIERFRFRHGMTHW